VKLDRAEGGTHWGAVRRAWRDYRFQYYLQKLAHPQWEPLIAPYARWLCRQWNQDHGGDDRLERVTVTAVIRPITLPGEEAQNLWRRTLVSTACKPER
jgi:hypothetical protein